MDIISQLKRDEGFVDHIYIDSVGKRTIGYGHNLDVRPLFGLTIPITEQQATNILVQDVNDTRNTLLIKLPWVAQLDDARLGVLINMSFNLGVVGLLGFKHFLYFVQWEMWKPAAAEMVNSKWYQQVGIRAVRLTNQIITGEWT